jgi:hypothetical protein
MASTPPVVSQNTSQAPAWANPVPAAVPTLQQHEEELFSPYSTLDEPVMETIMRDVRAVGTKLRVVMMPLDRSLFMYAQVSSQDAENQQVDNEQEQLSENDQRILQQLKDWDLWGPLVLCLTLGILLSFRAPREQASLVFAAVFCSVWVGGTVVTVNVQLLGGTISFFQSLCVLGYSIFPMVMSAALMIVLPFTFLDFIFVLAGFLWATRTSAFFISLYVKPERRLLALYPVFFFYIFLAWIIFLF